jgi:hypothetical protein
MQVCGGSGYTADWHIEQYLRDCRITMIYEGTNHIQALDLAGRKLPMNNGRAVQLFASRIRSFLEANADNATLKPYTEKLAAIAKVLSKSTMDTLGKAMKDPEELGAAATNYLRLFALCTLSFMWCLMLKQAAADSSAFGKTKFKTADFFFAHVYPEYHALLPMLEAGKSSLMALAESEFETA